MCIGSREVYGLKRGSAFQGDQDGRVGPPHCGRPAWGQEEQSTAGMLGDKLGLRECSGIQNATDK